MVKVGVIGLGPIGNRHARLYGEMENAELLGVCDVDRARADQAAKDYGTRAFYSVQEMVDADPSGVAFCCEAALVAAWGFSRMV